MPRWDRPYERVAPFGEKPAFEERVSERPGDQALSSDFRFWLYIAKGLAIMFVVAIVLTNAMYAAFELLDWLSRL